MDRRLYIEESFGLCRAALLEDGELTEVHVEAAEDKRNVGNIYRGRVQNVLPGMDAAFVDIGQKRNAFLYVGDIVKAMREDGAEESGHTAPKSIRDVAKIGQELLVQVTKEADGTKGARVTTHVMLPGRLLVLLPTMEYTGVSRRITEAGKRQELRALAKKLCPKGVGMIVRTAAKDASEDELAHEMEEMLASWEAIRKNASMKAAPCLVHGEEDLLTRSMRDLYLDGLTGIVVQGEDSFTRVKALAAQYAPQLADSVTLYAQGYPLFDFYRIEQKVDEALSRKVWLKSGGTIVIDETEALTVIDVNTGRYVGKRDLQETVLRINREAAVEIARQLRLRDIGGIVIIDFIDMETPAHKTEVLDALGEAVARDRVKVNIVGITELGLVELTRKKTGRRLSSLLECSCPLCKGTGRTLRAERLARQALREAQRRISAGNQSGLILCARPEVAEQAKRLSPGLGVALRRDETLEEAYIVTQLSESEVEGLEKI